MKSTLSWEPPNPGPWQQDSAHNPVAQTAAAAARLPAGVQPRVRGGLQRLRGAARPPGDGEHQRVHLPPAAALRPARPDGPKDPEWIGAEIGRRTGVAAQAFEDRIWREGIRRWDEELKPASIARHRALDVDLPALDDAQLQAHIDECIGARDRHGVPAPPPQHARPRARSATSCCRRPGGPADRPRRSSPCSTATRRSRAWSPPRSQPALDALRKDDDARALLLSGGDPADVLARLREQVPEVGEYIDCGALPPARGLRPPEPHDRRAARAASSVVCRPPSTSTPDEALPAVRRRGRRHPRRGAGGAPRRVRRRCWPRPGSCTACATSAGIYSEIAAVGLLRLALLELGRRLQAARPACRSPTTCSRSAADELDGRCSPAPRHPRPRSSTSEPATARSAPARERPGTSGRRRRPRRRRHAPPAAGPGDVLGRLPHRRHPRPEGGARG